VSTLPHTLPDPLIVLLLCLMLLLQFVIQAIHMPIQRVERHFTDEVTGVAIPTV
jgi:hypothetical protein